jgi:hypothetical protein
MLVTAVLAFLLALRFMPAVHVDEEQARAEAPRRAVEKAQ